MSIELKRCSASIWIAHWKNWIEASAFFWKDMIQGDIYQRAFARVAHKWLTPPTSTVDVERLFNDAGNIVTDHRKSMGAIMLEMLLFLKQNLKKVNFEY